VRIEDGGYVVRDANGFAVAYVYGSTEAEAMEAKQMTMDEARRVVSNIAKLPDMLKRGLLGREISFAVPFREPRFRRAD
jgi:hypothetical protein